MKIYATSRADSFDRFVGKPVWVRGNYEGESEYFKFHNVINGKVFVNMLPAECVDAGWKLTSPDDLRVVQDMFTDPLNPLNLYEISGVHIELDEPVEVLTEAEFRDILRECCGGKVDI